MRNLIVLILGWYLCSITLSLYNKWMFDPTKGLQIAFPILVTAFHQSVLWLISFLYVKYRKLEDNGQAVTQAKLPNWKFYLKYIVPTAIAAAGDIGFGNVSFKYISLTVYTIIKSASIAFVLLFGCMFKLEQFHWKLGVIVLVMFAGVVLMVLTPKKDNTNLQDESTLILGSFLVLISSCLSGLRWVYTQLTLRKQPRPHYESIAHSDGAIPDLRTRSSTIKKPHPIHTICQLAPVMGIALLVTSLIIERPFPGILKSKLFTSGEDPEVYNFKSIVKGLILLIIPGIEVFFMTVCEFGILQTAHVLTLSIAGIVKELLTIICGMILLGERLTGFNNWVGMCIILLDVFYYNYFRFQQDHKNNVLAEKDEEELVPYSITTDSMMQEYELDVIGSK